MKATKSALGAAMAVTSAFWTPSLCDITQGVSPELFARLDRMASLSMNVYAGALCGPPAGFTRAGFINETTFDTQGQVLRDDAAREAVVVFRGTASDKNFQVDLNVTLASFETAAQNCVGCQVHGGYYLAWTAAREQVLNLVNGVMGSAPGYGLVVTGHRCVLGLSFLVAWLTLVVDARLSVKTNYSDLQTHTIYTASADLWPRWLLQSFSLCSRI
jgi:feruloyl esterase